MVGTQALIAAIMALLSTAPTTLADTHQRLNDDISSAIHEAQQNVEQTFDDINNNARNLLSAEVAPEVKPDRGAHYVAQRDNIPGVSEELEQKFDRLAQCESSGNWHINTGNGYHGGLQFSPQTWNAYGGGEFAPYAYQASREQQMQVASRVLEGQGWGAWPACTASFGWR